MKILIAEDDPVSCTLLEKLLLNWGYEVVIATSGQEAIDAFKAESPPQMAILDWMMPEMDGLEVCREIRKITEDYTYIILLTARGEADDIVSGFKSGTDDYITKPFNKEILKMRLRVGRRIIELEEKLVSQVTYDPLTGLLNRIQFRKYLNRIIERPQRHPTYKYGLLFMGLDRFKIVNDSLGHDMGDQLLVQVSKRIEKCIRTSDVAARFSGDKFVVLIDDIKDSRDAIRIAERILVELSLPFKLEGQSIYSAMSIGIALSETGYEGEQDMLRDAESAMYRAKALGKSRYEIFSEEIKSRAMKALQLEADLWRAVENDEFRVHYQPIISLADGHIKGTEALIRWIHPEQGFVSPMDFIPLAEESGLITKIGEWVLRTACTQSKVWHDAGHNPLFVDVNFSSRQFSQNNILDVIEKILSDTGFPPQSLNIEITESIAMENKSIAILNDLTDMGVQTSIDDFGTGYSSLGAIKKFPINTIKIDRSFVKDISVADDNEAIVKAIISMARSLRMKVIAEGVETDDQLHFLRAHKCDEFQGFLFSKPVQDCELTNMLQDRCCLTLEKIHK